MNTREKVLQKIQTGKQMHAHSLRVHKPEFMTDIYVNSPETHIEVIFAENFKKHQGDFFYAEDVEKALGLLKALLQKKQIEEVLTQDEYIEALLNVAHIKHSRQADNQKAILNSCELLIARTGGILLVNPPPTFYTPNADLQHHIIWAFSSQLVYDTQSALLITQEKYAEGMPLICTILHEPTANTPISFYNLAKQQAKQELILFLIDDLSEEF